MRIVVGLLVATLMAASCASSTETPSTETSATTAPASSSDDSAEQGPGGYGFDRSDPAAGIANIIEAFATDEATATCIHEAWGDVANVPPAELTPELMTFEICGTSIFQLMTGDPRFTGTDG